MSLLTDYQARYSTQLRRNVSNPQNSTNSGPDTTRETLAAADASADFSAIAGVSYDGTNATHVTAACTLVLEKLKVYTGQTTQESYDKQLERIEKWYRLVLGRNRIMPTTNSTLIPTLETAGATPFSDPTVFTNFIGNTPGSAGVTDNPQRPQVD